MRYPVLPAVLAAVGAVALAGCQKTESVAAPPPPADAAAITPALGAASDPNTVNPPSAIPPTAPVTPETIPSTPPVATPPSESPDGTPPPK